jgi:Ser/Thr protein kinase RdoA (MazF antagonist)
LLFEIEGGVLMQLAPGRPLRASDLLDDNVLARVTSALAQLHAIDPPNIAQPDIRVALTATVLDRLVESAPATCLVHGDPSPANLIDDGERVRLVDFEYTRLAEPAYDLAALALGVDLDCDEILLRRIVSAYPGQSSSADADQLLHRTTDWALVLRELFAAWEAVQPPSPIG